MHPSQPAHHNTRHAGYMTDTMADFNQLALEFVLADDATKQQQLAASAAAGIKAAGRPNAVGQWILSVGPWVGEASDEDLDLIARGKGIY